MEPMIEHVDSIINSLHEGMDSLYVSRPYGRAKSNWASRIGKPCDLYNVKWWLDWHQAQAPDARVMRIFRLGSELAKLWIRINSEKYEIDLTEVPVEWPKYNISGRLDGRITLTIPELGKVRVPFEIKTVHPVYWSKFNETLSGWRDFEDMPYYQTWPGQGQCYLWGRGQEPLILYILINKSNMMEKFIPMALDEEYTEKLIQRAERVNQCVKEERRPDPIPYDSKICRHCNFYKSCWPDRDIDAPAWLDDEDLIRAFELVHANKDAHKIYNRHWNVIKKSLVGVEHAIIGSDFEVFGKERKINHKAQPAKVASVSTQWKLDYRKLGDDKIDSTDD